MSNAKHPASSEVQQELESKPPDPSGGFYFIARFTVIMILMEHTHIPHKRITERKRSGPHLTKQERVGFNGRLALLITNAVGTMWCAYLFTIIALISLPAAIHGGTATLISWIAQTFLQLVLLSVIMVGQKVAAEASDKQALQTYQDAAALLEIQDEVHRLIEVNTELTRQIHTIVVKQKEAAKY